MPATAEPAWKTTPRAPIARARLRQIVGHLVVDANDPALGRHLAKARAEGFRLNVNLLGEAVLGEHETAVGGDGDVVGAVDAGAVLVDREDRRQGDGLADPVR